MGTGEGSAVSVSSFISGLIRPAFIVVLLGLSASMVWQIQNWRFREQLARQSQLHLQTLNELARVTQQARQKHQEQRLALEQKLFRNDQLHQQAQHDAKQRQARLRDRLATADLRLSVMLANPLHCPANPVPATSASGGMVHGTKRAELDPAHAQRFISLAAEGDEGLIALAACQGYVREVQRDNE